MREPITADLWQPADRLNRLILWAVGAVAVGFGWWGSSGTLGLGPQYSWVSLSVGGLIVIGAGNFAWLLTGRRAVTMRRDLLTGYLRPAHVAEPAPVSEEQAAQAREYDPAERVAVAGMTRFHRPDCQLVSGKSVQPDTVTGHLSAGRRPCEMCDA